MSTRLLTKFVFCALLTLPLRADTYFSSIWSDATPVGGTGSTILGGDPAVITHLHVVQAGTNSSSMSYSSGSNTYSFSTGHAPAYECRSPFQVTVDTDHTYNNGEDIDTDYSDDAHPCGESPA